MITDRVDRSNGPPQLGFIKSTPRKPDDKETPVGYQKIHVTATTFEYDDKRRLLKPDADLWTETTETEPWYDIDTLLSNTRVKACAITRKQQLDRLSGKPGRPKAISEKDEASMAELLAAGLTPYQIAKRYQHKYAERTVYRHLKRLTARTTIPIGADTGVLASQTVG